RRMLISFGALSAVTHLLYVWLAIAGKSMVVLCIAVGCDQTANAMVAAAFVGLLMSVCSPAVSATQFALLPALSSVGHRVFGPLSADVVAAIGWAGYFAVCASLVVPGVALAGWATRVAERPAAPIAPAPIK